MSLATQSSDFISKVEKFVSNLQKRCNLLQWRAPDDTMHDDAMVY